MLQHWKMIWDVSIFHVLWLMLRCCSTTVWDVAVFDIVVHNFWCCSRYFSMLHYIVLRCCSTYILMLHYIVHIFLRCCTLKVFRALRTEVRWETGRGGGTGCIWGTGIGERRTRAGSILFCLLRYAGGGRVPFYFDTRGADWFEKGSGVRMHLARRTSGR